MGTMKRYIFAFFFLGAAVLLFALGNRERQPANVVQVTGIVRLVGPSLFAEIVISGEHEWYIVREEMYKLHDLQHHIVTVEGEESIIELTFANGTSAGIRRELRNLRIIESAYPARP
jgi:hypothetical protein